VTLPSSAEPVGRVAEEQVQQGNVEPDSSQQGSRGWSSQAFLIVVMATAALLGLVVHLFMRRRRTVSPSATPSPIPKNLEGGEQKAPLETTIGKTGEVVMPVADKLTQLPDQTGQGAAIPMSQNSAYSSKIESTNEEVLPDTVLIEPSELSTTNNIAVENVVGSAFRSGSQTTPSCCGDEPVEIPTFHDTTPVDSTCRPPGGSGSSITRCSADFNSSRGNTKT
jgi:hypothetical protein